MWDAEEINANTSFTEVELHLLCRHMEAWSSIEKEIPAYNDRQGREGLASAALFLRVGHPQAG